MLYELDIEINTRLKTFLQTFDPLFVNENVILSTTEDQESHFRRLERGTANKKVSFPSAVIFRNFTEGVVISSFSASKKGVARDIVLSKNTTTGVARTTKGRPVEIEYKVILYDGDFQRVLRLIEFWLLNSGGEFTKFNLTLPGIDSNFVPVSIHIESPEETRSTVEEKEDQGLIFRTEFPLLVRSYLVEDAKNSALIKEINVRLLEEDTNPPIVLGEDTYDSN